MAYAKPLFESLAIAPTIAIAVAMTMDTAEIQMVVNRPFEIIKPILLCMKDIFRSNEYAKAKNRRNNSNHTMRICIFNRAKLIARRFRTKITDRTNETTKRPNKPLSSGFPMTGERNSPKMVLVKLKAKKNRQYR